MTNFADRLSEAMLNKKNGVLVGLDPRVDRLPEACLPASNSLKDKATAFRVFCEGVIDAVAELVPAVKPQAAFFEQLGPDGMAALRDVIEYAQDRGLLVILDAKRNDIGSTAEAYAAAYLGAGSAYQADALTVSPYLGGDSLTPFVQRCEEKNCGIFVLVKTSNPGGKDFQDLTYQERPIYGHVADLVESLASESAGMNGYGNVGAVVGATYPQELVQLRQSMPHALLLIPGYGSQGGTAKDVATGFDGRGLGALVNSSRAIIYAHQRPEYKDLPTWKDAVARATCDMAAALQVEIAAM